MSDEMEWMIEKLEEYRDESLNQGIEFNCSDECFTAIMNDVIEYLKVSE
jgi:hypothetical protein